MKPYLLAKPFGVAFLLAICAPRSVFAANANLVVTTGADTIDATDGAISLREAMLYANSQAGRDTITFDVPKQYESSDYIYIDLSGEMGVLPALNDAAGTVIDGTTQPRYTGTPLILIDGYELHTTKSPGFVLASSHNVIRGLEIDSFSGAGVVVTGANSNFNTIRRNIFCENGIGIDLGSDGATPNDEGDADTGPNALQNSPVITSCISQGNNTIISGTLDSRANGRFKIDLFRTTAPDYGDIPNEQFFAGVQTVTTDSSGKAVWSFTVPIVFARELFSTTATRVAPQGDRETSEFSNSLAAPLIVFISGFSPPHSKVGANVALFGTLFSGATKVRFSAGNGVWVDATDFVVNSDDTITCTVPEAAMDGPIRVVTPQGSATSVQSFKVLPAITSYSPTSGPVGSRIKVMGNHLAGVTNVKFGSTPATFNIISDSHVNITIPNLAVGNNAAFTLKHDGLDAATGTFFVTGETAFKSFSPGKASAGDSIEVTGFNLDKIVRVVFPAPTDPSPPVVTSHSVEATFVVHSPTSMTVTVPENAASEWVRGYDARGQVYYWPGPLVVVPQITSFTPESGPGNSVVTITGRSLGSYVKFVRFNGIAYGYRAATREDFNNSSSGFFVVDDHTILAHVPYNATDGPINLSYWVGDPYINSNVPAKMTPGFGHFDVIHASSTRPSQQRN